MKRISSGISFFCLSLSNRIYGVKTKSFEFFALNNVTTVENFLSSSGGIKNRVNAANSAGIKNNKPSASTRATFELLSPNAKILKKIIKTMRTTAQPILFEYFFPCCLTCCMDFNILSTVLISTGRQSSKP